MRKAISLAIVFMNILFPVLSQEHLPSKADYDAFYNTVTLVVKDANPMSDYNFKIEELMEKDWKLTKYEFISEKEFELKKGDPSYSFLMVTTVTFDKDKTKARYKFISLLMGKPHTSLRDMPDLCSIPLSYYEVEDDSYAYKLDAFIRFIQNHVKLMTENPGLIKANVFKYYNKNVKSLRNKTLLVLASDLEPSVNSLKKIRKVYPYDVKIVTKDDIMKAIERQDPDIVFLHKVGPEGTRHKARCYNFVIGAADARLYYFDYHMVNSKHGDYLLEKDLKKMAGQ
jgi:hypothetical protein